MPIYEYECKKCGERFELLRSIKDNDNDIPCPKCGKESPKRLLSSFGTTSSVGTSCAPTIASGST
ncbi:MAG TPA: zinc ribbon domain-containing protein [Dehalococcoidia bacterium]|jgi:putative FmdB family regulatory protein|nr:zinc ribbon domain-containing protein [Dehalococcoidia bacterium]